MATRAEFEALHQQRMAEGDIEKANRIRTEKLGLPPIQAPNTDPQLQVDSGWREAGNVLSSLPEHALNFAGEAASAFNRSTMQGLDFMGTGTVNAGLRLAGSDYQLPTFEGGYNQLPGSSGGFMAPGTTRDVVRGAAGAAPAALGGYPVAGRSVASPIGAAFDFLGLGTSTPQAGVAPLAFSQASGALSNLPAPPVARIDYRPSRAPEGALGQLVNEGSESVQRAGMILDPYSGRAIPDPAGKASMKQGLSDDFVAMVEASTPETRKKLTSMLDIVEQGRDTRRFAAENRPTDIVGDSILTRFKVVRDANRAAGDRIDEVAQSLRGEPVDVSPAVGQFVKRLTDMGVKFEAQPGQIITDFHGSDVQGLKGPMSTIKLAVARMSGPEAPDAYAVHQLKRYIDEIVTYGKSKKGLGGKTERALKELRANLDSQLDQQFPGYNKVNSQYSETIGALNALQDVAGKKMELLGPNGDKAVGTLSRRLLSNAQSRVTLIDAVKDLDTLAKKYTAGTGTDIFPYRGALGDAVDVGDDIMTQAAFADELDRMFGTHATTSLQGDLAKVADRTAETAISAVAGQPTLVGALSSAGKGAYRLARGINNKNAMKAMRELLER